MDTSDNNQELEKLSNYIYKGDSESAISFLNLNLVNLYDRDGFTLLQLAVCNEMLELCKLLVKNGANVNAEYIGFGYNDDDEKLTALHYAARVNNYDIFKFLVESDANIFAETDREKTALHFAAEVGGIEICRLLIELGSNVNKKSWHIEEETPLMRSVSVDKRSGNFNCIKLLLLYGADRHSNTGYDPIDTARIFTFFSLRKDYNLVLSILLINFL
eukprot:TRINITY_DN644_c0_g1_i6.p1 TRINITY_DN644_c0_g1~~TRINITY_DN644_c0_g1_i6.p1  ORF type:complete len:237 (-),score=66.78 TRINITY_DN644_c0_g1_i6:33-683(-)